MTPEEQTYQKEVLRQTMGEFAIDELTALQIAAPITFVSYSKGRRNNGERRFRRYPVVVELAWSGGRTIGTSKRGDRIDERAAEILGDTVHGADQVEALESRIANLRRIL